MTYEYACEACGQHWEAEQSIKEAPLKTCAACGKQTAKRLVSGGTGFLLKGGGWYADGYGSKSAASSASDAPAAKSTTGSDTSSTKSDAGAKSSAPSESAAPKADAPKAATSPST